MTEQLWLAVLSSSLISGMLGAIIAGYYTLRAKKTEYQNEYYKLVLARRVSAYEQVESLVIMIKMSVLDKGDQRPYHLLFTEKDDDIQKFLFVVNASGLWIDDGLFELIRDFNRLIFSMKPGNGNAVEFGKQNYKTIAELRTKIEHTHASDMLRLHDVPRFLKSKKPVDSYAPVFSSNGG